MKNFIDSVQAKLKNISKKSGQSHQLTLTRYFQERLLFRLSKSKHQKDFFLKGGVLIYVLEQEKSRPTLDLDLMGIRLKSDSEQLKIVFKDICSIEFPEDGVAFDFTNIQASEINKEGKYNGIRLKIGAFLGKINQNMQVDIGFGDTVVPGPIYLDFPTLLSFPPPRILAYSIESLVAEKFEAMVDLGELNSRMKDFYDLYQILSKNQFKSLILEKAINATFTTRKTPLTPNHIIFSESFRQDENRLIQWKSFLKKSNLNEELSFQEVMKEIKGKLFPLYKKMLLQ